MSPSENGAASETRFSHKVWPSRPEGRASRHAPRACLAVRSGPARRPGSITRGSSQSLVPLINARSVAATFAAHSLAPPRPDNTSITVVTSGSLATKLLSSDFFLTITSAMPSPLRSPSGAGNALARTGSHSSVQTSFRVDRSQSSRSRAHPGPTSHRGAAAGRTLLVSTRRRQVAHQGIRHSVPIKISLAVPRDPQTAIEHTCRRETAQRPPGLRRLAAKRAQLTTSLTPQITEPVAVQISDARILQSDHLVLFLPRRCLEQMHNRLGNLIRSPKHVRVITISPAQCERSNGQPSLPRPHHTGASIRVNLSTGKSTHHHQSGRPSFPEYASTKWPLAHPAPAAICLTGSCRHIETP